MKDLSTFLAGFVRPLVEGGELHVRAPLTPATLATWAAQLHTASVELVAIDDARAAVVSELVVRAPALAFGEPELLLAGALYNTLVLGHPAAVGLTARAVARQRVHEAALAFAAVPPAETRSELLGRHSLLHNLFDLSRQDTLVRWWSGKAAFMGQRPPGRLIRWGSLRRVRVEQESIAYGELLASSEEVVARLLAASPLTDVLTPQRPQPAFSWDGAVVVLRDAELARAVIYRWHQDLLIAPAAAARAWEKLLYTLVPPDTVRAVTAFLVHLAALFALDEVHSRDLDGPSQLIKTAADEKDAGLLALLTVPAVAAAVDGRLAAPPGIDEDAQLARRWKAHRTQVRAAVGEARISELAGKLGALLTPRVAA